MDFYQTCFEAAYNTTYQEHEDNITADLKRGPWTAEEDSLLMNYVTIHGEGRWNSVARQAGLKRTGKSCRLRWLNYLRPDLRRGDMTPQEQLLVLELHSRWGNKWSKIAQYLPGRTDNEIKNYWRTRVQKQAKLLKCDVNSKKFQDAMKYLWMPRLREQIASGQTRPLAPIFHEPITTVMDSIFDQMNQHHAGFDIPNSTCFIPEMSVSNSDNSSLSLISDLFDGYIENSSPNTGSVTNPTYEEVVRMNQPLLDASHDSPSFIPEISSSPSDNSSDVTLEGGYNQWVPEFEDCNTWLGGGCDGGENLLMMDDWWSEDNMRFLQEQLSDEGF